MESLFPVVIKSHGTGIVKTPFGSTESLRKASDSPDLLSGRDSLAVDLHGHSQGGATEGGLLGNSTAFEACLLLGSLRGVPRVAVMVLEDQAYSSFASRIHQVLTAQDLV